MIIAGLFPFFWYILPETFFIFHIKIFNFHFTLFSLSNSNQFFPFKKYTPMLYCFFINAYPHSSPMQFSIIHKYIEKFIIDYQPIRQYNYFYKMLFTTLMYISFYIMPLIMIIIPFSSMHHPK